MFHGEPLVRNSDALRFHSSMPAELEFNPGRVQPARPMVPSTQRLAAGMVHTAVSGGDCGNFANDDCLKETASEPLEILQSRSQEADCWQPNIPPTRRGGFLGTHH